MFKTNCDKHDTRKILYVNGYKIVIREFMLGI